MSASWQAKNPEKWREYKRVYYAKNSEKISERKRQWNETNKERVRAARAVTTPLWWQANKHRLAARELLRAARRRAKASGISFEITASDFSIPGTCPLLGIPLRKGDGRQTANSPSLDRIDNSKGYVPGNVWVVSHRANTAKGDLSADELIQIGTKLKTRTLVEGASS